MSRKKIVAGNWKMNTTLNEAIELTKEIIALSGKDSEVERIVFPPFTFIDAVGRIINNTPNFSTGAQNCSEYKNGAYTGEVSAKMIQSLDCKYVLIGHSERRHYFSENNQQMVLKIKNAFEANLKVVFCFGEKLDERKQNLHFNTVKQQLTEVLKEFTNTNMQNVILAYEPVWAIGTGETATPEQAQEMHAYVRTVIKELFSFQIAQNICILYGGSCNAQNAQQLFACPDVDGGLIGGASLKAEDFNKICQSF